MTVLWQEHTLTGHTREVYWVAFSADGKLVVSGSLDRLLKIWEVETGAQVSSVVGVRCGKAMGVLCGCMSVPAGKTMGVV